MLSTELHGERRGWNLHLEGRVVRFGGFFLKVRIFRNVPDRFQNFIAHHVSTAAAKRKDGVAHQDHAGAWLILMAHLVDSRLLDQLSWLQRAIALIVYFNSCFGLGILQFHIVALFVFLPQSPARAARSNLALRRWDAFSVASSWCCSLCERKICCFLFGQPH